MNILKTACEGVGTILVADFLSGFIHWAEDTFWTEETPLIGEWIIAPNDLHHRDGAAFLKKNWWDSSKDSVAIGAAVVVVAFATHHFGWQIILFAIVAANANQFHKWAHVHPMKVPAWVRGCQKIGLLQHPKHHASHHRGLKNTAYCVITEYLNPVLDGIGFWRALERVALVFWSAPRRTDLRAS